ncbi:MAG TPA: hypothetical protein VGG57_10075 [Stellaceae bacterium]|jgi:hypothetical protein
MSRFGPSISLGTGRAGSLDRYVRLIPGSRDRWWFRRRVPLDLVKVIDQSEWRYRLTSRTRNEARREAIPFLDQTDNTIRLAEKGEWPPIEDEIIEAIATGWWSQFVEARFAESAEPDQQLHEWLRDTHPLDWALSSETDMIESISSYLEGPRSLDWIQWPETKMITDTLDDPKRRAGLRRNKAAMRQLLSDCRLFHNSRAGVWADVWRDRNRAAERVTDAMQRGILEARELERLLDLPESVVPTPANDSAAIFAVPDLVAPIRFNDPDDPDNDLIGQWARKGSNKRSKLPGVKTVYEARRMMRKLTDFVGFDDLRRLTRSQVQDWVDHLKQTVVKPGRKKAPMTISQHLIQLKSLANFAVDREIGGITVNPAAKVMYTATTRTKIRGFTDAEARIVLEAARGQKIDYMRWLPWLCCFTGARLDEPAGAAVADIEKIGSYWVITIRLDNRHEGASIKNDSSVRKIPLHPALIREGFLDYVTKLPKKGPLFPSLKPDKFGSKGGTATKRIGPIIRGLAYVMPSLADKDLSPSHSWRHRLHNECRRLRIRQDVEDAITGHAQEGSGPGYGEYAITEVLGPAVEETRSPFDAP